MRMNLYVIYDKVAEESGPVFEAKNDGTASRAYVGFLRKESSLFQDEFKLLRIGSIDKETNVIDQSKDNFKEVIITQDNIPQIKDDENE